MENEDVKVEEQPKVEEPKKEEKPAPKTTVPNYNFTRTVFEFDKKQFTEETINKKVLEYLVKHPYIHAEKIETFVNLEEKRIYFTVDGFGNADFSVDL
ncbi:DUF6465 family protein [Oribacterium sp. WCC10]|uniref:DUF6465 family protein n=1 Tax=Oribacterium sp. WCC10 TaxID=1855343 RepID=UPI0008E29937|nr:DUF6465 family protein [Oribacterium sp. WCC10]SFG70733.1 hypothetical protein SAMN05216356_12063 [Oribacterium sp. WCC10]